MATNVTYKNNSLTSFNSGTKVLKTAGKYMEDDVTITTSAGSAGTPTATKGSVSNHSVTVTPSVTNTTGYITGGTKTGTGVTITASELVSGTKSITQNGTGIDVVNYASVDVSVASMLEVRMTVGGSDPNITLTPNKTFAEAKSVLDAGGELRILDSNENALEGTYQYYPSTNPPKIWLSYYRINPNLDGHSYVYYYNWTSTGVAFIALEEMIGASNEFVITFTKDTNDDWTPDCTFDDAYEAFEAGKTVVGTTGNSNDGVVFEYDSNNSIIHYTILQNYSGVDGNGIGAVTYEWIYPGIYDYGEGVYYDTTWANAVPSDVASGKDFFNSQGLQTGTASGGQPTLQTKTATYTPTESQQTATITADSGYDGLSSVGITVNAISSTYVGSGITRRSSTNLTVSGATVTVPAGYYSAQASKSVTSGTATPAATISGTAATVSTGTNTITLTKSVSNTPTVSAGYIASGTAGNSSVSLTASVTTKAAATITPTTTNQTIASGTYLTGAQTIAGDANLVAANIKSGVSIFGINGSYEGASYTNGDNLAYGGNS